MQGCMRVLKFAKGFVILSHGADGRNRTGDLRVTSALLYQLSYVGLTLPRRACRALGEKDRQILTNGDTWPARGLLPLT